MQIAAPWSRPVRRVLPRGRPGARLILLTLLGLAIVSATGVLAYQRFFAPAPPPPIGQPVTVQRGNVAATVSATGSVVATKQAKLVFGNTGRLKDILVNVGDQVTAGQPLARLISDNAQNKLDTTRSQLATAQLKLRQLSEAATPEELTAAQAAYEAAAAKLDDLQAGPTAADLQAARAGVIQAQATAADTTGKLQTLVSGATTTDRAAAQAGLISGQNALAAARAKLDQLQGGATVVDLTTARNAVNDAHATLRSATAKLELLQAGATQADLTAAQAAFDKGQADVTSAGIKLQQARATSSQPPDVVAAQATLAAAEKKLHDSHLALDQLSAQIEQANADLAGQQSGLNASIKSGDQTCGKLGDGSAECVAARSKTDSLKTGILKAQQQVKLVSGAGSWDQLSAQKDVAAAQVAYDSAAASLKQTLVAHSAGVDLIAAQQTYDASVSALTSARAKLDQTRAGATTADLVNALSAVDQATSGLATAEAKLQQTIQGATDADAVAAQTAVDTAQATVDSAQAKLDNLGLATPQDVQAARASQASALAALQTAQAKLAQVEAGPTQTDLQSAHSGIAAALATLATKSGTTRPSDVALQQEAVRQAELAVQQAQTDLDNNTLVAPFDGVVGSINGNPGETAPAGAAGFLTLVDPREIRVDVTVDETDIPRVTLGKPARITFDAVPGRTFTGNVIAIAPAGTITQGVVNYPVSLSIDAREQILPAGLTASATLVIAEKTDVLVAPVRAVRRQGRDQVVDVPTADPSKTSPRVVKTGVQNEQLVEITEGVQEGEHIIISGTTTRTPNNGRGLPGGAPAAPGLPLGR